MLPLKRQRSGIIYLALSVILIMHYLNHNPAIKPGFVFSFKMTMNDVWTNLFNLFGMVNYGVYQFIGIGAYIFPLFLLVIGYNRLLNKHQRTEDRQAMLMLFALLNISLVSGVYDLLSNREGAYSGGWLGHTAIGFLYNYLNKFFTVFIVLLVTYLYLSRLKIFKQKQKKMWKKVYLKDWINSIIRIAKGIAASIENIINNLFSPDHATRNNSKLTENRSTYEKKSATAKNEEPTALEIPSVASVSPGKRSIIYDTCEVNKLVNSERQPPSISLLEQATEIKFSDQEQNKESTAREIEKKLGQFNISGRIVEIHEGPLVTQYELKLAPAVKISQVEQLSKDIALVLGSKDIRFEIPISGKSTIGIEIPNRICKVVHFTKLIRSHEFFSAKQHLVFPLGVDITGQLKLADISEMPHLLIGGATGSGKSVFLNTLVGSLLLKNTTYSLRLILIDMKRTELTLYNNIPHLLCPVITEPTETADVLTWLIDEMEDRYKKCSKIGVRSLMEYNSALSNKEKRLPSILVIIDEMADLVIQSGTYVESSIVRLAQLARAVGIHLIAATQRPSVKIITGEIKTNFPTRIAFKVFSNTDSRVILDVVGAEKLIGRGDMLYRSHGTLQRCHGGYISTQEVKTLVNYWK